MARAIGTEPANFSAFINGRIGLSSKSTIKLLQLLNLTKSQVLAKLGVKNVQIAHYQQNGVQMRLDSGGSWVPGQSGMDPNDSTGIDSTPTARDTEGSSDYLDKIIPFLKAQQQIYREAIGHIDDYLAGIQRAKPNKDGVTEPARKVNSNATSSRPGTRGDLFSDPDTLREHLAFVQREREKAEETVKLQRKIEKERELMWAARVEARRK